MKPQTKAKAIIFAVLMFASFTAGTAYREPAKTVTKEVFVEYRTPKTIYVEKKIYQPFKQTKLFAKQAAFMGTVIPASALHPTPQRKPKVPAPESIQLAGR